MARLTEPGPTIDLSGDRLGQYLADSFEAAKQLVIDIVDPRIDEINVQPPTEESLAAAAEVGIHLGRNTYLRQLGANVLKDSLIITCADYFENDTTDSNFSEINYAAGEAYTASGFRYVSVSFPE